MWNSVAGEASVVGEASRTHRGKGQINALASQAQGNLAAMEAAKRTGFSAKATASGKYGW
jgi:hypothetical protein